MRTRPFMLEGRHRRADTAACGIDDARANKPGTTTRKTEGKSRSVTGTETVVLAEGFVTHGRLTTLQLSPGWQLAPKQPRPSSVALLAARMGRMRNASELSAASALPGTVFTTPAFSSRYRLPSAVVGSTNAWPAARLVSRKPSVPGDTSIA